MNLVTQAKIIATQKHVLDNHQLYGFVPYTHHLFDVAEWLAEYGFDDEVIQAAAILHDILEDTRGKPNEMKKRDLEEMFGEEVANLVWAVTSEEGPNRKVRNALTYPKIRAAGIRAIAIKLADRLSNVYSGGKAKDMYKKEHADFRHGVYIHIDEVDYGDDAAGAVLDMQQQLDKELGFV